jgi:hypothetical protein
LENNIGYRYVLNKMKKKETKNEVKETTKRRKKGGIKKE